MAAVAATIFGLGELLLLSGGGETDVDNEVDDIEDDDGGPLTPFKLFDKPPEVPLALIEKPFWLCWALGLTVVLDDVASSNAWLLVLLLLLLLKCIGTCMPKGWLCSEFRPLVFFDDVEEEEEDDEDDDDEDNDDEDDEELVE